VKVPEPSLVVTPFSKKQPPPNDNPIEVTLETAVAKASGTGVPGWPCQSDHWVGSMATLIVPVASLVSRTFVGFDHQNVV
jgi:hypothetical protein